MKEEVTTYSIGAASRMAGVSIHKLRQWCDRYLPEIAKIKVGEFAVQRRFTERDVELVRKAKAYSKKGFTLEAAINQARKDLEGEKE